MNNIQINDKNFLKNFKICGIRIEDKKDVM